MRNVRIIEKREGWRDGGMEGGRNTPYYIPLY
jgi:hypothetical protein